MVLKAREFVEALADYHTAMLQTEDLADYHTAMLRTEEFDSYSKVLVGAVQLPITRLELHMSIMDSLIEDCARSVLLLVAH